MHMNYGQNLRDILIEKKLATRGYLSGMKEKMDKAGIAKVDRDNAYNLLRIPHTVHLDHAKAIRALDALDKIGMIHHHYSGNPQFLLARATSLITAKEQMQKMRDLSRQRERATTQTKQNVTASKVSAQSAAVPRLKSVSLAPQANVPKIQLRSSVNPGMRPTGPTMPRLGSLKLTRTPPAQAGLGSFKNLRLPK